MTLLLGVILLSASVQSIMAQSVRPPDWEEVTRQFRSYQYRSLILSLTPWVNNVKADLNYRLKSLMVLGQSHLLLDQFEAAEAAFHTGLKLDPQYQDLWDYQLMRTHLLANQHDQAVTYIRKLLKLPDNGFYLKKIRANISHFFDGEAATAVFPLLQENLKNPDLLLVDHSAIETYIRGARLLNKPVPRWLYVRQWERPDSLAEAELSEQRMQSLMASGIMTIPDQSVLKRYERLDKLNLHQSVSKTIDHYAARVQNASIKRQLGKLYLYSVFEQKDYDKILRLKKTGWLQRTFGSYTTTQWFYAARAYHRKGDLKSAENAVQTLERINPTSTWLPLALMRMAQNYDLKDRFDEGAVYWKKLVKQFPNHKHANDAFWQMVWHRYEQKRYSDALYYANLALNQRSWYYGDMAKFLYWKSRLEFHLNRKQDAHNTLGRLLREYPNTFYGLLVESSESPLYKEAQRLPGPRARTAWYLDPPPPNVEIQKKLDRQEFLLQTQQNEQATYEIRQTLRRQRKYAYIWAVSEQLYRHEEYHDLLKVAGNYYFGDLVSQPVDGQRVWQFAFPRGWWSEVQAQSKANQIDPYWILAIMREESLMNPLAVSFANAHGLMQLIPPTAQFVSQKKKVPYGGISALYEPSYNISLGSWYLAHLQEQFEGRFERATGSYNAGPGNMNRWVKESGNRPFDEFVESVSFSETRGYIKRVYRTRQMYKKIYGE